MTLRAAFAMLAASVLAVSLMGTANGQTAPSVANASVNARSVIRACSEQVGDKPVELSDLEQQCPQLAAALQSAGIRPLIIDSSRHQLNRSSLRQLDELLQPAAGRAPAVAALQPILKALRPPPQVAPSLWRRLWDWLLARFFPKQLQDGQAAWQTDLLRMLSKLQWLWTAILWLTCIALPVAVVIIVRREVRAMGRRSIDDAVTVAQVATAAHLDSPLALLRQVPVAQRPARLFALLIARLVAAGRLPPDRSLTHREVVRRAQLEDVDHRRLIESLARLSERQLYADSLTVPAGTDELLARGEDLYTTGWGRPAEP